MSAPTTAGRGTLHTADTESLHPRPAALTAPATDTPRTGTTSHPSAFHVLSRGITQMRTRPAEFSFIEQLTPRPTAAAEGRTHPSVPARLDPRVDPGVPSCPSSAESPQYARDETKR